jgi:hypothetical protein
MPQPARAALLLLVASGVVSVAPVAAAQEPVSVAWNAPAECPTGDAVLADVKAILGGPTPHRVTARADVTQLGPEHWSVHVSTDVDGTQGERTLEADSCTSLAKATALILAWAVDPVKARAALAARQAAPPPPPPPAPTPEPERTPAPATSPLPLAAVVAMSGMGDVGTLQSPGGGVQLALGALVGPLRFELSGGYWFEQDVARPETNRESVTVGAYVRLIDGALRACLRWRLGPRFELDPCAGASIVHASSEGYGGSGSFTSARSTGDWGVVHGDLLGAWRVIGPFALRASIGVELTPTRPPFTVTIQQNQVQSQEVLHVPSFVGGTATLGVEAHFP